MKILKETSEPALLIQQLEEFLTKNNMQIESGPYLTLLVHYKGTEMLLRDIDNGQNTTMLPRSFDSERFVIDAGGYI